MNMNSQQSQYTNPLIDNFRTTDYHCITCYDEGGAKYQH